MKCNLLVLLLIFILVNTFPLHAVTDEDEWSPEKHKMIGGGLCAIALLGFAYAKVTGMEVEYEQEGESFCSLYAPGIDSFHGFVVLSGLGGIYYLLRGITEWGLENQPSDSNASCGKAPMGIVQALTEKSTAE